MDNIASVYDLLNQDAEFARQVLSMRQSAASLVKNTQDQQHTSTMLDQKIGELQDLIGRVEGQLDELRTERRSLQEDIQRHEQILEEMQRLEESFNGAVQAYSNISSALEYFDRKITDLQNGPSSQAPANPAMLPAAPPAPQLPDVDATEVTTIEALFNKYHGKIEGPVVVIRNGEFKWSNEYCMAIKNVNKGFAWGIRYSFGRPIGKKPAKSDDAEYSFYAGTYYAEITKDFQSQTR